MAVQGRSTRALVRVWCDTHPVFDPISPSEPGAERWLLGRANLPHDDRVSRRHCEVRREARRWRFDDLGSANGSFIDGRVWTSYQPGEPWSVLQVGGSLLLHLAIGPGVPLRLTPEDGMFVGPGLYRCREAVAAAASARAHLVLAGPRGCGFEALARHYHRMSGIGGTFSKYDVHYLDGAAASVAPGVALLTGTSVVRRYAGHRWLAEAVQRPDLRLVIGLEWRPEDGAPELPGLLGSQFRAVMVPQLEARPEELPWLIDAAVKEVAPALPIDASYVEACLLKAWGGGIDGLVADTRDAIAAARSRGHALPRLKGKHLAESAGYPNGRALAVDWERVVDEKREPPACLRERDQLAAVLAEFGGDVESAAGSLGVVPEALTQWIRRHGL